MNDRAPARILIADDEPLFLRTTAELLRKEGYDCTTAPDGQSALKALEAGRFDLVLSDLSMPGNLQLELLQEQRRRWSETPLIVVTGAPSLPSAIESIRLGITDYLLKPVRFKDLLASVSRALDYSQRSSHEALSSAGGDAFAEIIGESDAIRELKELLQRVAVTNSNVLISGESGTGKEVVAKAIHRGSQRAEHRFQIIDCTAIPEGLFESMLFGHAKGSFTGAVKDQEGLLVGADKGTLFLDEIGELPAPSQAKLLRLIQEQTFVPVGKTQPVQVDTRFVCATNRDLEAEVQGGRFRQDLFYRLAVIAVELPPLRLRGNDVLLLADHFLKQLQPSGASVKGLSGETQQAFLRYSWPGNVRELRNVIERGVALAQTQQIELADCPQRIRPGGQSDGDGSSGAGVKSVSPNQSSLGDTVQLAERQYLLSVLKANHGNVSSAARQAGLSRQGLHKLLKKHGIDAMQFRP